MSETRISTIDQLKVYLRGSVSEHRFFHSLGVAETAGRVLEHYGSPAFDEIWKGFRAYEFCGIAHDLAREMDDASILGYCEKNSIILSQEDINAPVLAHGVVSAEIALNLVGQYPSAWYKALCVHTTGNAGMDDLALALFIADYIEPSRKFMTDEKRDFYLGARDISNCAYRVLCDMMDHWRRTGFHDAATGAVAMEKDLGRRGCRYE